MTILCTPAGAMAVLFLLAGPVRGVEPSRGGVRSLEVDLFADRAAVRGQSSPLLTLVASAETLEGQGLP